MLLCSASVQVKRDQMRLTSFLANGSRQVDSKDSLENVESKWLKEIAENCQGVKLVLVALKCDLRERDDDDDGDDDPKKREGGPKKEMIDYNQGLAVARKIQALRYLGGSLLTMLYTNSLTNVECSAMKNRGVNEVCDN